MAYHIKNSHSFLFCRDYECFLETKYRISATVSDKATILQLKNVSVTNLSSLI